jgi:threonine/homoserine/homoserine lactone efflux protein
VDLFYFAFLPQFIKSSDPVFAKTFLLVGIHYALGLVWLSGVILLVHSASTKLVKSNFKQKLELAAGVVFLGLGAKLAISKG